jgi:hypothetical protein
LTLEDQKLTLSVARPASLVEKQRPWASSLRGQAKTLVGNAASLLVALPAKWRLKIIFGLRVEQEHRFTSYSQDDGSFLVEVNKMELIGELIWFLFKDKYSYLLGATCFQAVSFGDGSGKDASQSWYVQKSSESPRPAPSSRATFIDITALI